jgi:hypothetical protein
MHILNFAHPLTDLQKQQIEELTNQKIEQIIHINTHFDTEASYVDQTLKLVDEIGLSPEDWQEKPILVNPPSFNSIACILLAELHGRMGYFAPIMRFRPVPDKLPPVFEVAEIINLQGIREKAREKR